jgi:hypothetical protein
MQCSDTETCVDGKCTGCPAGQQTCGSNVGPGTCHDFLTDPTACGDCQTFVSCPRPR